MKPAYKFGSGLLLVVLLICGLGYTGISVVGAVRSGDLSDASRQWEVCQYVRARINPYELAFRLLRDTFGPVSGPDRVLMREHRIYSVNSAHWRNADGLLPGHPPPEATYPPSTLSMLMPTIGFLPKPVLLPAYTAANGIFLAGLIFLLSAWFRKETGQPPLVSLGIVAALCLLFPPLQFGIYCGQPIVLALLCALAAMRLLDRAPVAAGALFMVALIKPSLVLLFAIIPLIRGKWKTLWTTFALGVVLTLLPSLWLREGPWVLIEQWMGLCRYLLQGAFTLQEVLNALAWDNTPQGFLVVLSLWGAVLAWCAVHRRARWEEQFAFLSLANLAWTYHERYDFALLAFAMVLFASKLAQPRRRWSSAAGLALVLILGASLSETFYAPDAGWAQAVRWAGRLSLAGLWIVTAVAVRTSHQDRRALPVQPPAA